MILEHPRVAACQSLQRFTHRYPAVLAGGAFGRLLAKHAHLEHVHTYPASRLDWESVLAEAIRDMAHRLPRRSYRHKVAERSRVWDGRRHP